MAQNEFFEKIGKLQEQGKFVCVGLDPQIKETDDIDPKHFHIPGWIIDKFTSAEDAIFYFNRKIIEETHDLVLAYKPNSAFYEAYNHEGTLALTKTVKFIRKNYPEIPIIIDAKRGDIGNTNLGYVKNVFDELSADAITINPWLGKTAMMPFLSRKDKGIIILVRTSNEGADEFQNLETKKGLKVYEEVADRVVKDWNFNENCAVVVGATCPEELGNVRKIVGEMQILIPGIGAQGGDLKSTVVNGKNSQNKGMIITVSRSVIYASQEHDFAVKAGFSVNLLNKEINECL